MNDFRYALSCIFDKPLVNGGDKGFSFLGDDDEDYYVPYHTLLDRSWIATLYLLVLDFYLTISLSELLDDDGEGLDAALF